MKKKKLVATLAATMALGAFTSIKEVVNPKYVLDLDSQKRLEDPFYNLRQKEIIPKDMTKTGYEAPFISNLGIVGRYGRVVSRR